MIANIIAGLSLLLSISLAIFYLRDRRHSKYQVENEYTNNLLKWHGEVVTILIKLRLMHAYWQPITPNEDLACLSALIEQGRFFFPNIDRSDGYGLDKSPAYRGYRNVALDFLVASYNLFYGKISRIELQEAEILQRHFTSVVFEIVRPKNRLETIRSLTDRFFEA
ncbi:MAG: hypothetical protein HY955_01570 [Deltaproteobacteria bacterium]|nr:hypothetical protein [Deltaproteobacteria bacterium]